MLDTALMASDPIARVLSLHTHHNTMVWHQTSTAATAVASSALKKLYQVATSAFVPASRNLTSLRAVPISQCSIALSTRTPRMSWEIQKPRKNAIGLQCHLALRETNLRIGQMKSARTTALLLSTPSCAPPSLNSK